MDEAETDVPAYMTFPKDHRAKIHSTNPFERVNGEDAARNRADNGPEDLAILRRLTLNLLRTARPKIPVSRKRKRSGWSDGFARTIIGQMR